MIGFFISDGFFFMVSISFLRVLWRSSTLFTSPVSLWPLSKFSIRNITYLISSGSLAMFLSYSLVWNMFLHLFLLSNSLCLLLCVRKVVCLLLLKVVALWKEVLYCPAVQCSLFTKNWHFRGVSYVCSKSPLLLSHVCLQSHHLQCLSSPVLDSVWPLCC